MAMEREGEREREGEGAIVLCRTHSPTLPLSLPVSIQREHHQQLPEEHFHSIETFDCQRMNE